MSDNHAHQDGENGPLTAELRQRIDRAKNKLNLTLAQVGLLLGFSGPFVSTLLRATNPGRVRSKHIERIVEAVEKMEVKAGFRPAPSPGAKSSAQALQPNPADGVSPTWMEDMTRIANQRGFSVTFSHLASH